MHALFSTESLILLGITVDGVSWDEWMQTEGSFTELRSHPLTVLRSLMDYEADEKLNRSEMEHTPHHGATNATRLVSCYTVNVHVN